MAVTTTQLTAICGRDDTTIRVASTAGFADQQLLYIDAEILAQVGPPSRGTPAVLTVRRGLEGTIQAAHVIGAPVATGRGVDFTLQPPDEHLGPVTRETAEVQQITHTLTDAQFKALNTIPHLLIPSPGANRAIIPLAVHLYAHFVVPYDARPDFDALVIGTGTTVSEIRAGLVAQLFNAGSGVYLNDFLTNVNGSPDHLTRLPMPLSLYNDDWGELAPSNTARPVTESITRPLSALRNPASAVLSGGSAANTLTIAVLYTIFDPSLQRVV